MVIGVSSSNTIADLWINIFCCISTVLSIIIACTMFLIDWKNESPPPGSRGAWYQVSSNIAFILLPIIPYSMHMRPRCVGGLAGSSARRRASLLLKYIVTLSIVSSIHHSMEFDKSVRYESATIPILWKSVDWSLARLSIPVACYSVVGVDDLMRLAHPVASDWWKRYMIIVIHVIGILCIVLYDSTFVASDPFGYEPVKVVITGTAFVIIGSIALCMLAGGLPVIVALRNHYFSLKGIIRVLNLGMSIFASIMTRVQEDDIDGWVHSMWHISTASILSAAMCLIFDRRRE